MEQTKLSKILRDHAGMFSKDIKQKISSGQFKLNGYDIEEDLSFALVKIHDAGTFVMENIVCNEKWYNQCRILGLETYFAGDVNNDLAEKLKNFDLLQVNKRLFFVIEKEP